MWKVYYDIVLKMIASLCTAIYASEAAVGVAIWAGTSYSSRLSHWIESVTGLDHRYMWIPLALVFLHLFFKALYERSQEKERRIMQRVEEIVQGAASLEAERFKAKRKDLAHLRKLLNDHADAANEIIDNFEPNKAKSWAVRAKMILDGNVKEEREMTFPVSAGIQQPGQLKTLEMFLRSLAAMLRPEDLKH